jgi:hypothetical protein
MYFSGFLYLVGEYPSLVPMPRNTVNIPSIPFFAAGKPPAFFGENAGTGAPRNLFLPCRLGADF